ncbi:MAG: phosphatase PAP2 family protein [Burkholderiales bacterium]|nr:phosphatase PAP2 family protein [Phycisphaerae bacterium]
MTLMNPWILISLLLPAAVFMVLEMRGVPVVLQLPFKGDIKRESQWLAQFGQAVATAAAMALIYAFEPSQWLKPVAVGAAVTCTSLSVFVIKRLTGRVRPNRENAGKFLGPTLKHANWRESFPSSHSACAIALTVSLSILYPQAQVVFWSLGLITAVLRYLMDAHWPSDVLAGIAAGYVAGHLVMRGFGFVA